MKKITIITLCIAALFSLQSCNNGSGRTEGISKGLSDSLSIALAVYFNDVIQGSQWTNDIDYNLIFKTMKALKKDKDKDVGIIPMQITEVVNIFMMKKMALVVEQNKKFLEDNKTKRGVIELPSGLQYKILEEGTGIQPGSPNDTVTVHYTGTLVDGTKFDSSLDRGEPAVFPLSHVIRGWTEGFQQLKEGAKAILYVPSDLGYGPEASYLIPGSSTLIFEVELIKVSPAVEPETVDTK